MPSPKADCFTPLRLAPLTGILDERSQPDEMPVGAFRTVLNYYASEERKLCRRYGHGKLRSIEDDYNNSDLHDQLLSLQDDVSVGRQPLSLLYASLNSSGASRLIAGTESRLYVHNPDTSNWKLFGEGFGTGIDDGTLPRRRFYAAQVGDQMYFTNDYDTPFCWGIGADSTSTIGDLSLIGLTRAGVVWAWHNIAFYADIEMDGKRYPHGLIWSDLNDGGSLDPAKNESITGRVFLEDDERILAGTELGNTFLIFTTRRIYEVQIVAGAQTFNFAKRYVPDDNRSGSLEGCLFYKNTLVSDGTRVFYLGEDGIYKYDLYSVAPERVEWIHKATKEMFDDIDPGACDSHIGHYDSQTKEIWFSYVVTGTVSGLPSRTIAINTRYPHTSKIDHGFTAFCRYEPKVRGSLREWFTRYNSCSMEELDAAGYGFDKEGLPRTLPETVGDRITAIINNTERVIIGYLHSRATSASNLTINATGPKTVVVTNTTNMATGQYIKVANDLSNYMEGTITGIVGTSVTFDTITATGSGGPFTSWTVQTAYKISVEDWEAAAITGSLCDKLGNTRLADICEGCDELPITVMASATDWCLKERIDGYYRERCTNPTATGTDVVDEGYYASVGTYVLDGYDSILRPGPEHFGRPELEKHINYIEVNGVPEVQAIPSNAHLRIGMSAEIMDPNDADATILWVTEDPIPLERDDTTAAEHLSAGTRPDSKPLQWSVYMIGHYLYWEFKVSGTGGGVCLSSVVRHVKLICR